MNRFCFVTVSTFLLFRKYCAGALKLQYDVYLLKEWCVSNSLKLNAGKCSVVSYTRKRMNYTLLSVALSCSSSAVDLGVIFDDRFTFLLDTSSVG